MFDSICGFLEGVGFLLLICSPFLVPLGFIVFLGGIFYFIFIYDAGTAYSKQRDHYTWQLMCWEANQHNARLEERLRRLQLEKGIAELETGNPFAVEEPNWFGSRFGNN